MNELFKGKVGFDINCYFYQKTTFILMLFLNEWTTQIIQCYFTIIHFFSFII